MSCCLPHAPEWVPAHACQDQGAPQRGEDAENGWVDANRATGLPGRPSGSNQGRKKKTAASRLPSVLWNTIPPVTHARRRDAGGGRLRRELQAMRDEICIRDCEPGAQLQEGASLAEVAQEAGGVAAENYAASPRTGPRQGASPGPAGPAHGKLLLDGACLVEFHARGSC